MKPTAFYVSSYFWDRATDAGIIGEKEAITWTLKPNDFSVKATKACASSVAGLASSFPDVSAPTDTPFLMPDLSSLRNRTSKQS